MTAGQVVAVEVRRLAMLLAHLGRLFGRTPWYAEMASSLTAMAWGVAAWASPQDLEHWPSMSLLLEIAPDEFWHAAGIGLGMVQIVCLLADWRWARWFVAGLMCWFWGVLTLGVQQAVPWAPGVVVYAGWAGINLFSILRLLRPGG